MHSPEGNRLVRQALAKYINAAKRAAKAAGLNTFHQRLAAFQNYTVKTSSQYEYSYDFFFGWMNPEDFDEDGDVVHRH